MITVAILINGNPITARSAVRGSGKNGSFEYIVDTGERVTHNLDDGTVALAKKLLDTIKEHGLSIE